MVAVANSRISTREVSDADEIARYLSADRLYAAYPLAELDGVGGSRSRAGVAYDASGSPIAIVIHHEGLVPQSVFVMGDPDGCRAVLQDVLTPREAYFAGRAEHQASLATLYDLESSSSLVRMAVNASTFSPHPGHAERLVPSDIDALNRLYQLGFGAGFPATALRDGVYYGVRAGGRLVAAAGTHGMSVTRGIAVVGNVMTHVDYRRRGLAKVVTSAVTAELLETIPDVTLNVYAENVPALAAYTRLGYREHCRFVERIGRRRSGSWWFGGPIREVVRRTWQRS